MGNQSSAFRVERVTFPETRVAAIRHIGPPSQEHDTARKLIAWKIENRLLDRVQHRSYGLHYVAPAGAESAHYRVDFCLSIDSQVPPNVFGIVEATIPALRCVMARDIGSRANNQAARYLYDTWLPGSGDAAFKIFRDHMLETFCLLMHFVP